MAFCVSTLEIILHVIWVSLTLTLIVTVLPLGYTTRLVTEMVVRGKTWKGKEEKTKFGEMSIPKKFFYFYLLGILVSSVLMASVFSSSPFLDFEDCGVELESHFGGDDVDLQKGIAGVALIMIFIQLLRRFVEDKFVNIYTGARMHITVISLGVTYYLAIPFSVCSFSPEFLDEGLGAASNLANALKEPRVIVAIIIYIYAAIEQNWAHRKLASLKRIGKSTEVEVSDPEISSSIKHYVIPRGRWFELVSMPHYFFEIVIYVAFFVLTFSYVMLNVLIFVIVNLSISGYQNHTWYKDTFGEEYPKRKAVIPFLF